MKEFGLLGFGITYSLILIIKLVPVILCIIVGMALADKIGFITFWSYWGFVYLYTVVVITIINIYNIQLPEI